MDRLERLTAQQEALLPVVRDEWIRIGLCTDRADRPAAEAGVAAAYRAVGLEPPRLAVWLGSPLAGSIAAAIVGSPFFTDRAIDQAFRRREGDAWNQVAGPIWDEVMAQARGEVWEAVMGRARGEAWQEVGDQVWDWAQEETLELFYGGFAEEVGEDGWTKAWVKFEGQVPDHVFETVKERVRAPVSDKVWVQIGQRVEEQIWEQGEEQQWYYGDREKLKLSNWGQHAANEFSVWDAFERLGQPGAERLDGHAAVARAAGWWWAFRHAVILTERPVEVHLDEQGRLHHEGGMAIRYPDGWGFHAWHGRRVPAWVVQFPTDEQITAEPDGEVRRCAIEAVRSRDPQRAITIYQQTLDDRLRDLGQDHPDTLAARDDLAATCQEAGDTERAIALYQQTFDDRLRVLGQDHPHTMVSRDSLAAAHLEAGDTERAIALYQQTLDDSRRVLGEDHRDTVVSRQNLAGACEDAGDWDRAIALRQQVLDGRLRDLGQDHPNTLIARHNLACDYRETGDLQRAIALFEQALDGMRRVHGEDHLTTMTFCRNLAQVYRLAGDLQRAIPLYQQALADTRRVLGDTHSLTQAIMADLQNWPEESKP